MEWFSFLGQDLAIDIGNNTIIAKNGNIVLDEPSVIAVDTETQQMVATGSKAVDLCKVNKRLKILTSYCDGLIPDWTAAEYMLKDFIKTATSRFKIIKKAVVSFDFDLSGDFPSDKYRENLIRTIKRCGVHSVYLIPKTMAAALGYGLDVKHSTPNVIALISDDVIELSVIGLGGIVCSQKSKWNNKEDDKISYLMDKLCEDVNETSIPWEWKDIPGKILFTGSAQNIINCVDNVHSTLMGFVDKIISNNPRYDVVNGCLIALKHIKDYPFLLH